MKFTALSLRDRYRRMQHVASNGRNTRKGNKEVAEPFALKYCVLFFSHDVGLVRESVR
jgi:hypothetical protein